MKVGDRYQQYTYAQLLKSVASAAAMLSGQGIGKGDRLVLLSENRPEWVIAYLSVVSLGAVIVPLDAQLTDREVALLLANSEAKAVFVSAGDPAETSRGPSAPGHLLRPRRRALPFPTCSMPGPMPRSLPPPAADQTGRAPLHLGHHGRSQGRHALPGQSRRQLPSTMQLDIVRPDDNMLCILPLHHTYPVPGLHAAAPFTGATITLLNSLKGPDITACMRETGVSIMLGVPQLFAGLRRAIFDEIRKKPAAVRLVVKFLLALNGLLRKTLKREHRQAAVRQGPREVRAVVPAPCKRRRAPGTRHLHRHDQHRVHDDRGLRPDRDLAASARSIPSAGQNPGPSAFPIPDVEVKDRESRRERPGRDRGARTERDAGLLQEARGHGRGDEGRLVPYGRPGVPRQGRLFLRDRPVQGDDRPLHGQEDLSRRAREVLQADTVHQGALPGPDRAGA